MNSTYAATELIQRRIERFLAIANGITVWLGLSAPPFVEVNYLRSLPSDSFGYAWAKHLDENGLKPFDQGPRRQQLHDGVHVLTGYSTDPIGEAEVQAFLLGAKFHLLHVLLLGGLLRGIERQRRFPQNGLNRADLQSRLDSAYRRGKTTCFDPDTWRPETLWEKSLNDVRWLFGLSD